MHVLFVCTGNICRSPTAERLAGVFARRLHIQGLTASSAGTRAMAGYSIHPAAAHVLEKLGGETSNFAARQLTPRIAADADLVIAMTREHRNVVLELAPHRLNRTFTLAEAFKLVSECKARNVAELAALRSHLAAAEVTDIPDPIGGSPELFETVGSQIASLLPPILELGLGP